MQNYYRVGVSLEAASLFIRGKGKSVYILPSSDPTFALLLVGYTEYDDDNWKLCYQFIVQEIVNFSLKKEDSYSSVTSIKRMC
ncbi:hypothetical protein Hanom_Chr10g00958781 [Helianthus anomalus]